MSYVKATNFAVKDGLPTGNPSKIVKGTEIDTEFNAIQTESAAVTTALAGKQPLNATLTNITAELAAKQAVDATLTSISALGTAADKIAYTTDVDTWAETTLTAAARTILDDTTVGAIKTTLGAASSGVNTDITSLSAPALGAATATTAALGTATTQVATTAFTNNINIPAFRAYSGAVTSITAAFVKVGFNSESFDSNAAFDSITNSRFQPQVPGWYFVNSHIQFAAATYATRSAIYKNGSVWAYGPSASANTAVAVSAASIVYLNGSTDYIELYASSATTQNTVIGEAITYFEAFRVFGA